jgi:hypothetical protein
MHTDGAGERLNGLAERGCTVMRSGFAEGAVGIRGGLSGGAVALAVTARTLKREQER